MHTLSTGHYTKHARAEINLRSKLREIIDANLKADRATHFALFTDKMFVGVNRNDLDEEAYDMQTAVINYWFSPNYPSVLRQAEDAELARMKKSSSKRDQNRAAKIEAERAKAIEARQTETSRISEAVMAETNQKLAKTAAGIREIKLFETVTLSNGKKLGEATLGELRREHNMFGGIVADMTKRGLSDEAIIAANMNEKKAIKLLGK